MGGRGASAAAVVALGDGKIVTAGGGDMLIARQNPNGSLDSSFATAGKFAERSGGNARLTDVALQSNGKTVFGGWVSNSRSALVMRTSLDGMLAPAFGSNGLVFIPGWGTEVKIAVQSDDKIVLLGPNVDRSAFLVARVNADGQAGHRLRKSRNNLGSLWQCGCLGVGCENPGRCFPPEKLADVLSG